MESPRGSGFESALMKKRRSSTSRRPRPETKLAGEQRDMSSSSSMSSWSNSRKFSSDEKAVSDGGFRRRDFYLNNPSPASASKHTTEGILAAANCRSSNKTKGSNQLHSGPSDSHARKTQVTYSIPASAEGHDLSAKDKPRKMKLKIGGITRTIPAKPNSEMSDARTPLARPPRPVDASRHRHKHGPQIEGSKDSSTVTSSHDRKKTKKDRFVEETLAQEQTNKLQREPSSEPVRKSMRVPKKRFLDGKFDEDHNARHLEILGTSRDVENHTQELANNGKSSAEKKKVSKTTKSRSVSYQVDDDFVMSRSNRDGRKRLRESSDGNNTEEEEATSDSEPEAKNKKQKPPVESPTDVRSEPLTTRRRALQSWMDGNGDGAIEFPHGLPPAPSRSKKEKLSEEEMLAKKAEAAQRRRMQVEKAARETETEAIRKILGLDSDKKKEEKKQKERQEKERAARSQRFAGSTVRWVMGPTGTVVSFPEDVGLPSIFNSKPCSYPPPREKCAGPLCTNAYRYRDSKLKLPLCSLECYRALHGSA